MTRFFALAVLIILTALPVYSEEGSTTDSLSCDRGVLVITREDFEEYNIHTLDDVLRLVPGVSVWREGPPGAAAGFSVDGRDPRGVMLLLNGKPLMEPYSYDQLSRFVPISRLERVEIYYSGSPFLSGEVSTNAAINVVIEEGGRETPNVELDFTYGGSNRRARRAWFATPEAHISAVIAYDEYLQDAFELYPADPAAKLGKYGSRSVLTELRFTPEPERVAAFRFQRFDDTYLGTYYSAAEDVRHEGYEARIGLRLDGLSVSLRQRVVDVAKRSYRTSSLDLEGNMGWVGSIRGVIGRLFFTASRSEFENVLGGERCDPSVQVFEGGVSAEGRSLLGLSWRLGVYAGDHGEIGDYLGGEAGISYRGSFSPRLQLARTIRVPTVQELFQPESLYASDGYTYMTGGNRLLEPALSDELSVGACLGAMLDLEFFMRSEKRRITDGDGIFETLDGGDVMGVRGRAVRNGALYGIEYGVSVSAEYFGERSEYTRGIPEYRGLGGILLRRRIFKDTETISIRYDAEATGGRTWGGEDLASYMVHDLSASLTLLGARLVFQYKNLLDESYETVPGFLMPGRHYIIGVWWELID